MFRIRVTRKKKLEKKPPTLYVTAFHGSVVIALQVQTELSFICLPCLRKNQGLAVLFIKHSPAIEADYYSRSTTFAGCQSSQIFQSDQINMNIWVSNENLTRIIIFINTIWAGDVGPTESTCARHVTAVIPRQNFLGKTETMAENVKVAVRVRPFISFCNHCLFA